MVIRSSDSRRRRAVIEEASSQLDQDMPTETAVAAEAPALDKKKRAQRDYLPAAQRRHHSKTTDWIPKRRSAVAFFLLGLSASLAALIGLALFVDGTPTSEITNEMAASSSWKNRFSLHGAGSLSVWFSTVLLLISSLASLQIRALRQHRSNDYRGTYRVWLWFAALLMLASINCVLDLDGLARNAFADLRGPGGSGWILPGLQWIALVAILTRGAIEVRQSPASLAMIVLVWLSYSASMILRLPGAESMIVQDDGFKAAGLELFAIASLFAAITVYSRFVYLRANGLVAAAKESTSKSKVKKTSAKKSDTTESVKTKKPRTRVKPKRTKAIEEVKESAADQPEPEQKPKASELRMASTISNKPTSDDSDSDNDSSVQFEQTGSTGARSLSKAERKRMKKLQRNEQNRRAA